MPVCVFILGTPGRVKHMIAIGALDPRYIKTLVLDEVDVMLSRGFEDQVYMPLKACNGRHTHTRCLELKLSNDD